MRNVSAARQAGVTAVKVLAISFALLSILAIWLFTIVCEMPWGRHTMTLVGTISDRIRAADLPVGSISPTQLAEASGPLPSYAVANEQFRTPYNSSLTAINDGDSIRVELTMMPKDFCAQALAGRWRPNGLRDVAPSSEVADAPWPASPVDAARRCVDTYQTMTFTFER